MHPIRCRIVVRTLAAGAVTGLVLVPSLVADEASRECLLAEIESAAASTTVAEIRERCGLVERDRAESSSAIERRLEAERRTMGNEFVITPHRPNYVLPVTSNSAGNGQSLPQGEIDEQEIRDEELKFQISLKVPLWRGLGSPNTDLFFAFSVEAWWQAYSGDLSAPFRDVNYEPELILRHYGGPEILGLQMAGWDIGLNHESNGRGGELSRSWNRILGTAVFDLSDDFALGVRAWYRIPDEIDDNPGIYRYLGYGEARLVWAQGRHAVTAMVRPGTEETSFELTWSMHLEDGVRLYTQYFDGYGESLLDYDKPARRFGIGLALSDFLQ